MSLLRIRFLLLPSQYAQVTGLKSAGGGIRAPVYWYLLPHKGRSSRQARYQALRESLRPRVSEAIIEDLKRVVPNAKGAVFSVTTKTEMAAGLRTLFEQKRIRLPNDKKLIMQIKSLRHQVSKTGNLLFESTEKEGVHDDYL
jgi:hypothetical protein